MRFWAEHPEDAERIAKENRDFNEAFINHPDAQEVIRKVAITQHACRDYGAIRANPEFLRQKFARARA